MVYLTEEWLELEKALGARPILHGTAEEITEQYNDLGAMLASQMPPPSDAVTARDETADGVPIRIYAPKDHSGGSLPVGVYTHGGGFVCGNLDSEDPICRAVAEHTPCIIVSVDYRLGPKYKLPTMLDDSVKAYAWAWHNASKFGGDQSKFFSIGGSAGGGLALGVANKVVGNSSTRSHIQGVVAMTPTTLHPDHVPDEYKSMYKSYTENGKDVPIIDLESMQTFFKAVDADPKDANVFTALSKNLAHFPPTYIATCGADPLRDDGVVMEHALKQAGVKTKSDSYPGMPHYFWIFPSVKTGQQFVGNMLQGVKFVLSS